LEYQPAPDSPGREAKRSGSESDDSVDPLDAYMQGIDVSLMHTVLYKYFIGIFFSIFNWQHYIITNVSVL